MTVHATDLEFTDAYMAAAERRQVKVPEGYALFDELPLRFVEQFVAVQLERQHPSGRTWLGELLERSSRGRLDEDFMSDLCAAAADNDACRARWVSDHDEADQ